MPIALSCPCGRALNIKDEFAGRKIRCPECKSVLAVPAAEKETEADDLMLEVLPADEPEEVRPRRESRRAAIQTEIPDVLPARSREDDEKVSSIRRRTDEEEKSRKRRPKLRREQPRGPKVVFEEGWFGSTNSGVAGGVLMIVIALVWLVIGVVALDRLFFYPLILAVIGLIAIAKGLAGN
ncbi:MAG TPA: hypothetical protein VH682_18170 [Gemmataceae bacterium]|jgi:hypothetical protein